MIGKKVKLSFLFSRLCDTHYRDIKSLQNNKDNRDDSQHKVAGMQD